MLIRANYTLTDIPGLISLAYQVCMLLGVFTNTFAAMISFIAALDNDEKLV